MTSKVVEHDSNWDSEEKETCKGTERDRKKRTGEKEYDWQAKASMERRSDRKKTYRQFGPDEGKHEVGEDLRRQCKVYLSTYGMQVPWTGARHSKPVDTLHCDWEECEGAMLCYNFFLSAPGTRGLSSLGILSRVASGTACLTLGHFLWLTEHLASVYVNYYMSVFETRKLYAFKLICSR